MADRAAPGLFAARGGGDAGHPVVEQSRQRQTDRQGGKVSTDPSRRTQLIFPPYGEFAFSKRKYSLFFFFFWPIFSCLTPDTTRSRKTREPSPSGVPCQDKGDPAGLKSLNFVPKVAR